jgi:hypothetical protein
VIDQFQEVLVSLGQQLGLPLHPDKMGACRLNVRNLFSIQLEYEPARERILIASFLCDIPPGKLRENILRDALKANFPYPELGSFGYSERNNKLSLFFYLSLHGLTGVKLAALLSTFIEKATKWKQAVELGQTGTLVLTGSSSEIKPFGLKP